MRKPKDKAVNRRSIAAFHGRNAELNGPRGRPFFRVRLDRETVVKLRQVLQECSTANGKRRWYTLTSTADKPNRLRLTEKPTPDYEVEAGAIYARGEAFRISGEQSCNIDFSGEVGSHLLERKLAAAQERTRDFLDICVPNRARNLIEFVSDMDLESTTSVEHDRLAVMSGRAAAEVLGSEDFNDWEVAGV